MQKAVKISHYNVIANVIQKTVYDKPGRAAASITTQSVIGVLPFSHIYGLVPITHLASYRGDEVIVLPRFDLKLLLSAIERFRIDGLALVPPIFIQFLRNKELCAKYDLSSVGYAFTGAAPMGKETADELLGMFPKWTLSQGYGE